MRINWSSKFGKRKAGVLIVLLCCLILRAAEASGNDSLKSAWMEDPFTPGLYETLRASVQESPKKISDWEEFLLQDTGVSPPIKVFYAHLLCAHLHWDATEYALALSHADTALQYTTFRDDSLVVIGHWLLGAAANRLEHFETALIALDQGLRYAKESNHPLLVDLYLERGRTYRLIGLFAEAKNNTLTAVQLLEESKDSIRLLGAYQDWGALERKEMNKKHALELFQQSLKMSLQLKDTLYILKSYGNLAVCYAVSNINKSERFFDLAFALLEEYDTPKSREYERALITNQGLFYVILGQWEKGLRWLKRAEKKCREAGNQYDLAENLNNQGATYRRMNNFENAIVYYQKGGQKADSLKIRLPQYQSSRGLSQIYYRLGNHEKALFYLKKWLKVKQEIYGVEQNTLGVRVEALHKNYQVQQALKQAKEEEAHLLLVQKWVVLLSFVLLGFLWLGWWFFRQKERQKKQFYEKKIEVGQEEKILIETKYKAQEELMAERNKALAISSLRMIYRSSLMQQLRQELQIGKPQQSLQKLQRQMSRMSTNDQVWEQFRLHFEQIHVGFYPKLSCQFPELTAYDLRLCAFIHLGFLSSQIADYLSISPSSVEISRHRLRKKLGLEAGQNLSEFLKKLNTSNS